MSEDGPARRIGIQSRSMTGTRPDSQRYESALERDFMELVEWEHDFLSYQAQPVWVSFVNIHGVTSRYPPDGLVRWKLGRKPLLVEIKYRKDCAGQWRELRRKFRAARIYADAQGWDFHVVTEDQVRGQRQINIRFLLGYRSWKIDKRIATDIQRELESGPKSVSELLSALGRMGHSAPQVIPMIWHLVANRVLSVDMELPISTRTVINLGSDD